jgi:NADH-quinone oxidoreductase subunit J
MTLTFFWIFGVIAMVSALVCITRRNPVASALWLVITLFALAAMFVLLDAQFIAALQVLVYAGAIMGVFLFVIMLLNLGHPSELADARGTGWKLAAGLVGLALLAQVLALARARVPERLALPPGSVAQDIAREGAIAPVARLLFTEYLLAFELTSILLLTAIVGAVVLARRRQDVG